jgi:putative transposase
MSYIRVWVHLVFSTKNRERMIPPELKPKLLEHIKINAMEKELWIDSINCMPDHMHILISLGSEQSISKTAMLIKGESSFWINKNKLIAGKFVWQDDYYAVSVGETGIDRLRNYIAGQEKHHRKKSFQEEYDGFV